MVFVSGVFFYDSFGKASVSNDPIPAGHVEIRVEFQRLSTKNYNNRTAIIRKLAEDHTDRLVEDFNGFHGTWNDGFVNRRYRPNHPIPSPEVEQAMSARLESFLKKNSIDGRRV